MKNLWIENELAQIHFKCLTTSVKSEHPFISSFLSLSLLYSLKRKEWEMTKKQSTVQEKHHSVPYREYDVWVEEEEDQWNWYLRILSATSHTKNSSFRIKRMFYIFMWRVLNVLCTLSWSSKKSLCVLKSLHFSRPSRIMILNFCIERQIIELNNFWNFSLWVISTYDNFTLKE